MRPILSSFLLVLVLAACGAPPEATSEAATPTEAPTARPTGLPATGAPLPTAYPSPDSAGTPGAYPSPHAVSPTPQPPPAELYYLSEREGQVDLWRVDPQTGLTEQVTDDPAEERWPAFSPDGSWLAYTAIEGDRVSLRLLDVASAAVLEVDAPASPGPLRRLAWLDGDTLLADAAISPRELVLFRITREGEIQPLTAETLPEEAILSGWSAVPGMLVVQVESPEERSDLYAAQVTEDGRLMLREHLAEGVQPQLSPNGRYLAYRFPPYDDDPAGYLLDLSTGERRSYNEAHSLRRWDHDLSWSPDSARFSFVRSSWAWTGVDGRPFYVGQEDDPQARGSEEGLYMGEHGGEHGGTSVQQLTQVGYDTAPAWSHDGQALAFVANRSDFDRSDIWLLEIDSGEARRITGGEGTAWFPFWRPR